MPREPIVKTVKQANLTSECVLIQMFGKSACLTCDVRGTKECGGKKIRKTGKNSKGIDVGESGVG